VGVHARDRRNIHLGALPGVLSLALRADPHPYPPLKGRGIAH